jgi:hypothetical protein
VDVAREERVQRADGFLIHCYGNRIHRYPKEWRFPRCGVRDLRRQWWIGDTTPNIPPLNTLRFVDVEHLQLIPLTDYEKQRKSGPNKNNRRKIAKTLYDLKLLCRYHTNKIVELGRMETDITIAGVDRMFACVAHLLVPGKFFLTFTFYLQFTKFFS